MNTHYLNGLPQEWTAIAEVFSALGDGTRQTILLLFEPGEPIELKTFVDILPLSRSAVVHHLKVLEQAGLLIPHQAREGSFVHAQPCLRRPCAWAGQGVRRRTACRDRSGAMTHLFGVVP